MVHLITGALAVKLFRSVRTVGAQNSLTESRSISVTGVTPNTMFGCGKYKHWRTLRDNRHGPDFLLNSMKKFCGKKLPQISYISSQLGVFYLTNAL